MLLIQSAQERDWAPLHALLGTDRSTERGPRYFMFMGQSASGVNGEPIYLYKHSNTRRYLNIGADNRCYRYTGPGGYVPMPTAEAIEHVLGAGL